MVEKSTSFKVDENSVFTRSALPLFSHLTDTPDFQNKNSTQFLINLNHALSNIDLSSDQNPQKTLTDKLGEQQPAYKPLVIVGPSGAGKGTLINKLVEKYKSSFGFSVSFTTRAPRPGEEDGKHYHFVTKEKFEQMVTNDEFIENCVVHNNFYGTEKAQVTNYRNKGIIPLLDIDIQGARKVYTAFKDSNFVFICPPSMQILKDRLVKRGTEKEEQLQTRMKNAIWEIQDCIDLKNMIQYRVINDDLEKASEEFVNIIEGLYQNELVKK